MRLADPHNIFEMRSRAIYVAAVFGLLMGLLLVRVWYLQIWQGEVYRQFSDQNRFKIERLSAPRGQIIDRDGALIADSRPRFDVYFTKGADKDWEVRLNLLREIFKWNEEEYQLRLNRLSRADRYVAQPIARDLLPHELALIELKSNDLSGVDVQVVAVRDYLYQDAFFHVIGFTGEIGEEELKRLRKRYPERDYRLGDARGVSGLEAMNEGYLRGRDGQDFQVVDVRGRKVNEDQWKFMPKTQRVEPRAGKTLQLSLDLGLQLEAIKAFEGRTGAAVAVDPSTGEVLAYVSRPALDPNLFSKVLTPSEFVSLKAQKENPFLDRVVGEHYPPGSTLKLVMAAAAIESGVVDQRTTHFCNGSFRLGRRVWKCHKKEGHGWVNVVQALAQSCDVFFYNAALAMGLDSLFSWSVRFGFGRRTFLGSEMLGSDLEKIYRFNSEQTGFIPYADWILSRRDSTVEAETVNAGIGQGAFLTTILQLARMTAALGNGGKIWQPMFVRSMMNSTGEDRTNYLATLENTMILSDKAQSLVTQGMEEVVSGKEGTARASRIPDIRFGGKTGTAQVVNLEVWKRSAKKVREFEDHALFVGTAPMEKPRIAVAVIVEHGGQGSRSAAPIAKRMIQYYLKKETTGGIDGNIQN